MMPIANAYGAGQAMAGLYPGAFMPQVPTVQRQTPKNRENQLMMTLLFAVLLKGLFQQNSPAPPAPSPSPVNSPPLVYAPPPPPAPIPAPPVAANQRASVTTSTAYGADGGSYQFPGGRVNLLKDNGVTLNVVTENDNRWRTPVIRNAGLVVGNANLFFTDDGNVQVNGRRLTLGDNEGLSLGDGAVIKKIGNSYFVNTREYNIQVDSGFRSPSGAGYLNVHVHTGAHGVLSDGVAPTGYLGETFDRNNLPQRGPLNDAAAYQVRDVLDPA